MRLFESYTGNMQDLPTEPLFKKHGILKANQIYDFKLMQRIKTEKLYDKNTSDVEHRYTFRHSLRRPPQIRTNYGKQTKDYQVTKLLNSIGTFVDFNNSFSKFKKELRTLLVGSDTVL